MTKALLKRLEEGKLYYSISEVCQLTGLEQHVLRYWETEFPQLKPKKNRSGNRAYRNKEIKLIRYIKYLLYDEQYTIQGAKRKIADASTGDLEGQVNLLGSLPGVGAAQPHAAVSVVATASRRSKTKARVQESVHETPSDADSPLPRDLLLGLKQDLNALLLLLQAKS
jgi:DNA-binding transcriptional MerR regulator